uniref:C3H1-type domain-containing protein n=1 Tax=Parascaris univalens TaxID=6257 RepID=A0A915B224_PARUN
MLKSRGGLARLTHPPLRRISNGVPLQASVAETARSLISSGEWITFESHDSCYSSCSEESHSSLSREPSDTLTNDSTQFAFSDDRLVEFATKLGYTEEQLQIVLEKLGPNAGQDEVLSELIKLGRKYSESSSKSNMAHTSAVTPALRSIVIDGSNIAMTHGRKEVFSCRGIRDCVQFFRDRGHTDILVFVPQFRREAARSDCPITDQHILLELEDENVLVWTPSRRIGGRRIVCHDDRYILKTAEEKDAVIVSNDEYRDLVKENPQYRKLVEQRLLMYSFVDGKFMPPDDPLGRHGPKLAQFLSKGNPAPSAQLCPYARKCTYGNKCKYFHPERPNGVHVSVTERLLKGKQQRKHCLSARPSLPCDNVSQETSGHSTIVRTKSLNVSMPDGAHSHKNLTEIVATGAANSLVASGGHRTEERVIRPQISFGWAAHCSLSRNLSAPVRQPSPLVAPSCPDGSVQLCDRSSSVCSLVNDCFARRPPVPSVFVPLPDSSVAGVEHSSNSSHLFAPSTAVWGESELSVGPLTRCHAKSMNPCTDDRARLQGLLCQLFPEAVVIAVMEAHPNENDPQKLCARIIELQKGFDS